MALVGRVKKHPGGLRATGCGRGGGRWSRSSAGWSTTFVAGADYTVADIALYGYVHCADEAGADLREYPRISAWLERVEATPGFVNDLAPITWTDS